MRSVPTPDTMAPRMPVPLREIVYTLSPYQQEIMMKGISKLPAKLGKFVADKGYLFAIFGVVLMGPITYANNYKEWEKIEARY